MVTDDQDSDSARRAEGLKADKFRRGTVVSHTYSRPMATWLAIVFLALIAAVPLAAQAHSAAQRISYLSFPDEVFGMVGATSPPKHLAVSIAQSRGSQSLISDISITGPNSSDFTIEPPGNCAAAGSTRGRCGIEVTFTPTALGTRTAALAVIDTSGNTVETVELKGRGVKGGLTWAPREISYGRVRVGATSAPISVTVTNKNSVALKISRVVTISGFVVAGNCVGELAGHGSCQINVAFSPTSANKTAGTPISAMLEIEDDAAGSPHRVKLSGVAYGVEPQAPTPTATPTPDPPPLAASEIYAANSACGSVTGYSTSSDGNVTPIISESPLCSPAGVAVDSKGNVYVTNHGFSSANRDSSVMIYPAGSTTPSSAIQGPATGLDDPQAIATDSNGNIYVANEDTKGIQNNTITVYSVGSTGNVAPIQTIGGSNTGLSSPSGIAVSGGKIYVANGSDNTVTIYPASSTGNVAPSATIEGYDTGLATPSGVAVDGNGNIYVSNQGGQEEGCASCPSVPGSVTVYAAGSSGDAIPTQTLTLQNLGIPSAVAVDGTGNLYVTDSFHNEVFVFNAGSLSLDRSIVGGATDLDNPSSLAVDSGGKIYVVNEGSVSGGVDTVTAYAAGRSGNALPSLFIGPSAVSNFTSPSAIAADLFGTIYVADNADETVTAYSPTANLNIATPIATVYDPFNGIGNFLGNDISGVAVDTAGNVYLSFSDSNTLAVFSGPNSGGVAQIATIQGSGTGLSSPAGIALDSNGNIYVTNDGGSNLANFEAVTVYPAGSSGDVPPTATIAGSNTGLAYPAGIAVDSSRKIYVANKATDAVTVYSPGSNGNVTPIATISGASTGLDSPAGITLDSSANIYVANEGGFEGANSSVTVYPPNSTGNATPSFTISGPATQLGRPLGVAIQVPQ